MPRYPAGFLPLCASVAAERFSFFLFYSLLALNLNEHRGLDPGQAASLVSYIVGASYLTPLLGGVIADGRLGHLRTAALGCLLASAGYALLLSEQPLFVCAALTLIVLGVGFFKSCSQALTGRLYLHDPQRRDSAFTLYYLFVNIGGLFGPILGSVTQGWLGWNAAFLLASLGMLASWLILAVSRQSLRAAEAPRHDATPESPASTEPPQPLNWRRRLIALYLTAVLFTVAHMQLHSTLMLWVRNGVDRQVFGWTLPASIFPALPAALVLCLLPPMSWRAVRQRIAAPAWETGKKITAGMALIAVAFLTLATAAHLSHGLGPISLAPLLVCVLFLTLGELLVGVLGPSLLLRLVPAGQSGRWIGIWYAATSLGFVLAAQLGRRFWNALPPATYFLMMAAITAVGAALASRSSLQARQ